jgi:phosphatidylglycerophosphate synthase
MGERLQKAKDYIREEVLTVPNIITLGRLVLSPLVARRLEKDPVGKWKQTGLFMMSDNLDGFGAKVGSRSAFLSRIGFRKSEFGRKADPFTDTIVTSEMLVAGVRGGVVPKWLAGLSLAQKALKSYHGVSAWRQGTEVQVSDFGRHMEGVTNLSVGMLFPGEGIENEEQRRNYRQKLLVGAVVGIAGAYMADRGYVAQAEGQQK